MATTAAEDKLRKPLAFEATDPRGNIVICAQSVWDGHITKYHPEMNGRVDDVQVTIADPDGIRESTARAGAQIFERVIDETIQIRAVVTYDEISLAETGQTIAKMNSAFPIYEEEFDKPQVGHYIYSRPKASSAGEEDA